jgi:hypothetical protein
MESAPWTLNPSLSTNVKNAMKQYGYKYSVAVYQGEIVGMNKMEGSNFYSVIE